MIYRDYNGVLLPMFPTSHQYVEGIHLIATQPEKCKVT